MSSHWTYEGCGPTDGLEQGDILRPSDDLKAIFQEIHPHFADDKYLAYLITTQSCDLVVRKLAPKAAHINIVVVRPLAQVAPKLFAAVANPVSTKRFRAGSREEIRRLLERIVNQNEQAIGLFFLYPEIAASIAEPAVAFLRVSIALRSDHYDVLRAARVGRLSPEFRAKLGWLVGNLYVRPATPDWSDQPNGKQTIEPIIADTLEQVAWLDDELLDEVKAWGYEVGNASNASLELLRPPSRMERALREVDFELAKVAPNLPADVRQKLQNRLRNSGKFKNLLR